MFKKIFLIITIFIISVGLSGCTTRIYKQSQKTLKELSSKKTSLYVGHIKKKEVVLYAKKLSRQDLKNYFEKTPSGDIIFVSITNDSQTPVIFLASETRGINALEQKIKISNNVLQIGKAGNQIINTSLYRLIPLTFFSMGVIFIADPYAVSGNINEQAKYLETYYQSADKKALKNTLLMPKQTIVGLLVISKKQQIKELSLKFQTTNKIEYFNITFRLN